MNEILVEQNPSSSKLDVLNVENWPIWEKEISIFDWKYDQKEVCYILAGEVIVTPDNGDPVLLKEKDLVYFPKGMSCTWDIQTPIRKHYQFE